MDSAKNGRNKKFRLKVKQRRRKNGLKDKSFMKYYKPCKRPDESELISESIAVHNYVSVCFIEILWN